MKKYSLNTIGLSRFGPQVQCAGYFQFSRATEILYRLKLHHLVLMESGQLDAITPVGPVRAHARDLICFRPAPMKTGYQVTPGTSFYQVAVQFAPEPRHLLTPELPEIGPLPVLTPTGGAFGEFQHLFESICLELPQAGSIHHFRMQADIYRLLALLASSVATSAALPPALDAWEHIRLRVSSTEGDEICSDKLAREVGVSRAHFLRVFKQRFGKNPALCRMHARLGEAIRRLRESNDSIKAISYSLGFDGAKGLTRAMKKHLNLTASQIRTEEPHVTTPSGLLRANQHILPPGDRVDLLMARFDVNERHLDFPA